MDRFKGRVYMAFGSVVIPWTRHVRTGRPLLRRVFDMAQQTGDLNYAAFSRGHLITNYLASGDPLVEVQREAEVGLVFARQLGFGPAVDFITVQLQTRADPKGPDPDIRVLQ